MDNAKINLKAVIALLVCIFFWSSAFVCIRFLMINNFDAGGLSLARYFVASIAMLFIFVPLKNKVKPNFKELLFFAVLGFLGFFSYNIFLNKGEYIVSAGIANFIIFQIPILEIILAFLFFGERINKFGFVGLSICLLGASIIFMGSDSDVQALGVFFVYIAAISGALYTAFQKKLLKKFHPIEAVSYFIWFGTLFLVIYTPEAIVDIQRSTLIDISLIVYMGIFPGALSYLLWGYAFKHVKISIASSFLYVMPIFTILLGWIFLAEIPELFRVIGGLFAALGAIIITRFGVRK